MQKAMREISMQPAPGGLRRPERLCWDFFCFIASLIKMSFPYSQIDPSYKWMALGVLANTSGQVAAIPHKVPSARKRSLAPASPPLPSLSRPPAITGLSF